MRTDRFLKIILLVITATIVSPAFAVPVASTSPTVETPEQKLERLTIRAEQIKAMDKRSLSKAERKALKKELRDIREETKASNGVYISAGALIVIVILLIVLL
jgi:hypothetical protein